MGGQSGRRRRTQALTLHLIQALPVLVVPRQVFHEVRQVGKGWIEIDTKEAHLDDLKRNKQFNHTHMTDKNGVEAAGVLCVCVCVQYLEEGLDTMALKALFFHVFSLKTKLIN